MKKSKRTVPALFAVLLMISALTGCGKKNDAGVGGVGVGVYPGYTAGGTVAASFQVGGSLQLSNATGWVYGSLNAGAGGGIGGVPYSRTNSSGDQVVLYLSAAPTTGGVGYSTANGMATVYLSQSTMSYVNLYCGGNPRGISFPSGAALSGSSISGQVLLVAGNGQGCLYL
jgi:hypothetical protein